jgi:hypothetical protein
MSEVAPPRRGVAMTLTGPSEIPGGPSFRRVFGALVLFGLAFGFVEAAVVIDIRAVYEPLHQRLHPHVDPDDLFPVLTLDDLRSAGPMHLRLLRVELAREAATIVMLGAIALAGARNWREWLGGFLIAFGVWDLAFYAALRLTIGWPASLAIWDLLFLLPVPWAAPVAAPMAVAAGMMVAGAAILRREDSGHPVRLGPIPLGTILLGAATMVVAFCWGWRVVVEGRHPASFAWGIFLTGGIIATLGFLASFRDGAERSP